MSIHDKIQKAVEKIDGGFDLEEKDASITTDLGAALYSQTVIPKTKSSEYLRSAMGWVYGCVGVIADEVASIELHMLKLKNGDLTEIDEHPALDVIYKANNAMTRFDLIQLTFQYLELTGEAPWYVSFKNGKPDQIFLLRPDRLTVLPGTDGELIGGYKYRVYKDSGAYEEIKLEPFEIIPLRYCDPDNPVRGKGPLQAAARTVDLENYAEKWNMQFFANSASPSAAFSTDKTLGKEIRNKLEAKIKEKYQGVKNAHKTLILEGGLKYQALSLSQKDMDFVLQQQMSRDKILSIFRVPPTALGLTADVTRANAEATDYVFAKRTIKPKMLRFVEQLNEFFLPLFGNSETLYFDFDDPVPENVDQDIALATAGVNNGFMTINEARERLGLDAVPDGDTLRDPASMQPILNFNGQPIKAGKKKKPTPSYYKHMNMARNRNKNKKSVQEKIIKEMVQESLQPIIENILKKKNTTIKIKSSISKSILTTGTWEEVKKAKYSFQEKQLNLADSFEKRVIGKLNTVFRKQAEIILRGLDNGEKMILDVDKETDRYMEALKPVMLELFRKQADLAFQFLGIQKSVKLTDKTFLQTLLGYFDKRTFTMAQQVTRETNDKLKTQFSQAVEKGESIGEIKSRIGDLFKGMEGYRSERIARSETIRGSNYATQEAYKESGVVEAKEWLTTKDEATDDECMAMDGKVIPLDDNFFHKGDTFGGLKLDYENVGFPPLHVNCRCTLIPVISTPIRQGEWRPSMNAEQAKDFVKDSKFKDTLYHGTIDKYGDEISRNGFNLSHQDLVPGVYLSNDKAIATQYAADRAKEAGGKAVTLPVKINAKRYKIFDTTADFVNAVESKYGNITEEAARKFVADYDLIKIADTGYFIAPDPKTAVVLRK